MFDPGIRRVLRLQWELVFVAVLLSSIVGTSRFVPFYVLLGGLAGIFPAIAYAMVAYARRYVPPAMLVKAHFKAEMVKFLCTILLFAVIFIVFKDISVAGLFGGYLASVAGYWFGLLIKY